MTYEKLVALRRYLIENIFRNPDIVFSDNDEIPLLLNIIAGLYEYLNESIESKSYDYMWHWTNKIGYNDIETYYLDDEIKRIIKENNHD